MCAVRNKSSWAYVFIVTFYMDCFGLWNPNELITTDPAKDGTTTMLGWNDLLQHLSTVGKSKKNACRALHRLVEGSGVTLNLPLDPVHCRVRRLKPVRVCEAWWPTLSMHEWCSYVLEHYPRVLLAGHTLDHCGWQRDFKNFWDLYKSIDPGHPVYESGHDTRYLIPYAFHGDEGRGRGKVPFLVFAMQPIISHRGMSHCNDSTYLDI